MSKRTKLWIQLITGIILMLFILWLPEIAALALIGMIVLYTGKKLWNVPVGTMRQRK